MEQVYYLISDAAKMVEVESHVLRYWEEELAIPIKRNELGHRYYTSEDIEQFRRIKSLKEQGLQLKAIRMVLKDGKLEKAETGYIDYVPEEKHMIEIVEKREIKGEEAENREEKSKRLQILLQHMIAEAVKDNNIKLCEDIKECVIKEMDYQFRQLEEKDEERESERRKREEEHYRKIDELLRGSTRKGRGKEKEKEKKRHFGLPKRSQTSQAGAS